jgi:hypothetical protein
MKHLFYPVTVAIIITTLLFACKKDDKTQKITMTTAKPDTVAIYLAGSGAVTINWGNKKSETYILTDSTEKYLHDYSDSSERTITITTTGTITYLYCYDIQLTSLNAVNLTSLSVLRCGNNQLTSLNVSGCKALKELYCYNNKLTDMDISGCTALKELDCKNNQLSNLDLSGFATLTWLHCGNNQLTSLNVSGCAALTYLNCQENYMTAADLDDLFNTLNSTTGTKAIQINGNGPDRDGTGTSGCDKNIAEKKGWSVFDFWIASQSLH